MKWSWPRGLIQGKTLPYYRTHSVSTANAGSDTDSKTGRAVSQDPALQSKKPIEADAMDGRLKELVFLFLKLGTVAFGGPAAHIAMMEDEVVRRRRWLSKEDFLDLFAATNLIPGPNSTEMAIHIGHKRAGFPGLLVAGICFILPAACIVLALAWVYVRFGRLPEVAGMLYGVKPVVIAVVLQALWGLGRTAVKGSFSLARGSSW